MYFIWRRNILDRWSTFNFKYTPFGILSNTVSSWNIEPGFKQLLVFIGNKYSITSGTIHWLLATLGAAQMKLLLMAWHFFCRREAPRNSALIGWTSNVGRLLVGLEANLCWRLVQLEERAAGGEAQDPWAEGNLFLVFGSLIRGCIFSVCFWVLELFLTWGSHCNSLTIEGSLLAPCRIEGLERGTKYKRSKTSQELRKLP